MTRIVRRSTQRGEGAVKNIIILAVVLYAVIVAIKVVPAKITDKDIIHEADEITRFAGTREPPWEEEAIAYNIHKKLVEEGIPLEQEDVEVTRDGGDWRVQFSYGRNISLIITDYKYTVNVDVRNPRS